jgi:hypothetical protein
MTGVGLSPRRPIAAETSATSNVGRGMAAGRYAGAGPFLLFLNLSRGCDSKSSGLLMVAIIPNRDWF